MRSVFDRVKMSRAKLAYIVDSTAAPVASLALIGTWVGAEITFIQQGLDDVADRGALPVFVNEQGTAITGMQAFLASLPYRFYPILALFLVFLVAWSRRDFGPMKRAEENALAGKDEHPYDARIEPPEEDAPKPRWWLGLIPVVILVGITVLLLILTGYRTSDGQNVLQQPIAWWEKAYLIINGADAYLSIYYGALLAAIVAMILTIVTRACSVRAASDAGLDGMARMFPAIVILILAWALSRVEQDLMLGEVANAYLQAAGFPIVWMPLAIFVCAAVISFATGTSWGTMGILCPAVVAIMAGQAAGLEQDKALPLFYAAVGSVLAGAIFGDHCSPISDTTVLSSVASGCRHEDHVWTQIPYALVAAVAAMAFGDVMCSVYEQPWYFGLGAGAVFLVLVVLIFGRQAKPRVSPPRPEPIPAARLTEPSPPPPASPFDVPRRADDPSWQGPSSSA
jgi:Na+/H+ antiporter NhaC